MSTLILGIVIGTFVGWVIPQPAWARALVDTVTAKVKS